MSYNALQLHSTVNWKRVGSPFCRVSIPGGSVHSTEDNFKEVLDIAIYLTPTEERKSHPPLLRY